MHAAYVFDRASLAAKLETVQNAKVLLVGDVMLDEYLAGDVERISPEAPIPIVKVAESRLHLGGAGNVARNITSLGGEAHLIGVCGEDAKGAIIRSILAEEGVGENLMLAATRPTTLKTRVIARNQQMLRIDHEDTTPLVATEIAVLLDAVAKVIEEYPVIVVSDYGKGVVSDELMRGIIALRNASRSKPRILVDPKTPNFAFYNDVFIMTPNAKETSEAANMPARSREEILAAGRTILRNLRCERLLTTLGANGMALFLGEDTVWHIPTAAQKVFDVTGAGDTVMATLALCLASGLDLLDACVLANYAAGIVVAEIGASAVQKNALLEVLATTKEPEISRWA
ncbi:D-glycero-beta-D-manno-heptose-7-phosphate kinase [Desulfovibrio sp. OttesenSCG-928-O18]|nr:D-glycero-beta-D-manno-heptose-7-phosphate kinase [Desulfovibrio sp. OttesenSCG-928-O18]